VPGQLYLQEFRAGRETVYGTSVTPSRRLYFRPGAGLNRGGETRRHQFLTGTRDNTLEGTPAPSAPIGTYSMPVSSDECNEILACFFGPATITTPGGTTPRLHTFVPGTPDSMTLQWYDGARPWQETGVYTNTVHIAGSANGENILDGELFGAGITQTALTGTAVARTPSFFEGWETTLAIDAYGGADNYGATVIAAGQSVVSWDITATNNLGRKFTAANTNAMQSAIINPMEVTGTLTFEAAGAQALTEYNNFVSATKRRVRLKFGTNDLIETTFFHQFVIDIPLVWTGMNLLGEDEGTRVYEGSFGFIYDPVPAFGLRIQTQSIRTANF
jgi:hypothetical protein